VDAALLGATGVFVVFLNVWLVPRRQGFQRRYAQRGILVGALLMVMGLVRAL
jgi:hypothetical protein